MNQNQIEQLANEKVSKHSRKLTHLSDRQIEIWNWAYFSGFEDGYTAANKGANRSEQLTTDEVLQAIKMATAKATISKEAAIKFIKDAGIYDMLEDALPIT